MYDITGDAC